MARKKLRLTMVRSDGCSVSKKAPASTGSSGLPLDAASMRCWEITSSWSAGGRASKNSWLTSVSSSSACGGCAAVLEVEAAEVEGWQEFCMFCMRQCSMTWQRINTTFYRGILVNRIRYLRDIFQKISGEFTLLGLPHKLDILNRKKYTN